jgi:hypothetical protein
MSSQETLQKLTDAYTDGRERTLTLKMLLETKASQHDVEAVLVDLGECATTVGDLTRELERVAGKPG